MKIAFAIFAAVLAISGCANERYFSGNGFEAVAYKEQHEFNFTIQDSDKFQSQLLELAEKVSAEDREAVFFIEYKNIKHRKLVDQALSSYRSRNLVPLVVEYAKNSALESDLSLVVAIQRFSMQTCLPSNIRSDLSQPDCFVESMRLTQIAYKSRVVGE